MDNQIPVFTQLQNRLLFCILTQRNQRGESAFWIDFRIIFHFYGYFFNIAVTEYVYVYVFVIDKL